MRIASLGSHVLGLPSHRRAHDDPASRHRAAVIVRSRLRAAIQARPRHPADTARLWPIAVNPSRAALNASPSTTPATEMHRPEGDDAVEALDTKIATRMEPKFVPILGPPAHIR